MSSSQQLMLGETVAAAAPTTDPYFDYVTMLLHGDGTNGAQNNTFLDSSTNNFTITRVGNTTQGSFSPYGNNWSNYFDGNGDYLQIANSTALDLPGDFTIEAWIYITSTANADNCIVAKWGTTYAWLISANPSTKTFNFYYGNSGTYIGGVTLGTSILTNTWQHVAATRSGSSVKLFVDGTQVGTTQTITSNCTSSDVTQVGKDDAATRYFNGYISNVRVVKGTALYTSAFTPSTTPLTTLSGTALLTCQSNQIVDNSANRFTITKNGDTSVQRFSPFSPVINTPTYGAYFDGTGDYLTFPQNAAFNLGTGNFTIECWAYFANSVSTFPVFAIDATSYPAVLIQNESGTVKAYATSASTSWDILNGTTFGTAAANQWHHIALTRSGTSFRTFLNGSLVTTVTSSASIEAQGGTGRIGASDTASTMNGYISNVRVVKGTALYTAAFTPSTTPLTAVSGTSLLTCQSSTFIDNSTNNFAITVNGNSQPSIFSPFASTYTAQEYSTSVIGGSAYFDGSGDYLAFPQNTAFNLGSNLWTIQGWFYATTVTPAIQPIFTASIQSFGPVKIQLETNTLKLYMSGNGTTWSIANGANMATSVVAGQWYHFSVGRTNAASSPFQYFVNGVFAGSIAAATVTTQANVGRVGNAGGADYFNGYLADIRVVNGVSIYDAAYSPPVAPLTSTANTRLLLSNTNAGIYDNAEMNDLETLGNAQISTTVVKYGTGSIALDGTGDGVVNNVANPPYLWPGAGDFTMECWVYPTSSGTLAPIFGYSIAGSTNSSFAYLLTYTAAAGVNFKIMSSTLSYATGTTTLSLNTWTHIACVRYSNTLTLYVNGTANATTSDVTGVTANNPAGALFRLGISQDGTQAFPGYIDDFRFTLGYARYTANFTPPTAAFPNQ